jgi:hypothetical protein
MKQLLAILALTVAAAAWTLAADEVELTGKLGCGHCTYKITKGCATAFKTADGKIYVITNPADAIKQAQFDGGTVKVTGTVTEKDDLLTVQASKQVLTK